MKTLWAVSGSIVALVAGAFIAGQTLSTKVAAVGESEQAIQVTRLKDEIEGLKDRLSTQEKAIRDQTEKEQFISLYARFLRTERDVFACSDVLKKPDFEQTRNQAENAILEWFADAMRSKRLIWKKSPDSPPSVVFHDGTSWKLPDSIRYMNCAPMLALLSRARPDQQLPETEGKILLIFP